MNFVIYFFLTCELPVWLGFFSYNDVAAGLVNFLVPQGSLMSCNIDANLVITQPTIKIEI
jgi:hypothetical protein